MRNRLIRNKRARYGSMTVLLTVLLIATLVLCNALVSTLASRYSWYTDLNGNVNYDVTESCYNLLGSVLSSVESKTQSNPEVEIVFCDLEENLLSDGTSYYVYQTARSLAERFPEHISVKCVDIWINPSVVRPYMNTTVMDPETGVGTVQNVKLQSTSVILVSGSYHRVYSISEFFVFASGNTSTPWAYNGERKLAAGIMRAVNPTEHTACLLNNHGEAFYDSELIYLLDDAGYKLSYVDLYQNPIPADCDLLISFNPNKDLTQSDGVSETSEADLIEAFLETPGHSFFVFIEDGTPSLPNYEALLADWGVSTCYHKSGDASYRYMVQNQSGTLTSDGYTIYGVPVKTGHSAELLSGLSDKVVFKDATALRVAQNFVGQDDGSYVKGNRTLYSLYTAGSGAVNWANGKAVDAGDSMLMTLTEQKLATGSSYVCVVASVKFSAEDYLQSAVYENSDTLLHLLKETGTEYVPEGLTIKPFQSTQMSIVTTAQKLRWTILLTLLPVAFIGIPAGIILVRRKHH